jgi:APA family basic amino acid/polyamine antiporter
MADTEEPEHQLRRDLSVLDLVVFGVGVIIGTGIFVLTGKAAGVQAGPAVALSFVVAAIVCGLAALCYAEFASTVPVAGSAYTFSYATIGELLAWIIGWDLILELALGASTVAVGWSNYFATVMETIGITLPKWTYSENPSLTQPNLVAALIVLILTAVICLGIKVSARINAIVVAIKVAIVLFVIIAGLFYIKASNYSPFIPPSGSPAAKGAKPTPSLLADLGFSSGSFGVADLPRGIIGSLAVCTFLYVAVSLVVTGMVKYNQLSIAAPLAEAFRSVGRPGFATVISVGALAGLTTVMMILLIGQSRVFFAMSRDRLLPPVFSQVSPRTGTPIRVSVTTGIAVAIIAAFVPLTTLAELVNIGTLFAFVLVAIGVLILRRTRPDLPRAFKTPFVPVLPVVSVLASFYLMLNLPAETWARFVIWMVLGFVVYFLYSRSHSRLATEPSGRRGRPEVVDVRDSTVAGRDRGGQRRR